MRNQDTSVVDPEWFFFGSGSYSSVGFEYCMNFLYNILDLNRSLWQDNSFLEECFWRKISFLKKHFCWEIVKFYHFSRIVLLQIRFGSGAARIQNNFFGIRIRILLKFSNPIGSTTLQVTKYNIMRFTIKKYCRWLRRLTKGRVGVLAREGVEWWAGQPEGAHVGGGRGGEVLRQEGGERRPTTSLQQGKIHF